MGERGRPNSRNSANYPNGGNDLKRFGRQANYFWNRVQSPAFAGLVGTAGAVVDALIGWHPKDPQGHSSNAGRHNLRKELPMELTGPVTTILAFASFVFVGAIIVGMI